MFSSNSSAQISSERNKSASYGIEMMLKLSTVFNQMSDLCKSAVVEFSKDIALNQEFQNLRKFRLSDEGQEKLTVVKKISRKQQSLQNSPFQKIRVRKNPETKPEPPKSRKQAPKEQDLKLIHPEPIIEEKPKAEYQPRRSQRTQRVIRRIVPIIEEKKENLEKENTQKVQNLQKKQPSIQKAKDKKPETPQKQANKKRVEFNQPNIHIPRQKIKDPILVQNSDLKPPEGKRSNRSNKKPNIVLSLSEQQVSSEPSDYKARRASNQRRKQSTSRRAESRRKPKKVQAQDGKKRPINGFMRFFQQVKDEIKKNNKINGLPDLSHLISVEWGKLTRDQQEKYNDAYYLDLEKMKEEGIEIKTTQRRRRPARKSKRSNAPKENQNQQEPESIREEIASDKEAEIAGEAGSGTSSQQEPQLEEESPKVSKDRKKSKTKQSPAKKEQEQEHQEKEDDNQEESGESSESSGSEGNEDIDESSSGQDNSESSSQDGNDVKESKSNSKVQSQGRSESRRKK